MHGDNMWQMGGLFLYDISPCQGNQYAESAYVTF